MDGRAQATRRGGRHRTALVLLAVATFVAGSLVAVDALGGPAAIRERFGCAGILIAIATHWILNLTPAGEILPSATASGAAWGLWLGAAIAWLGWIGASLTQYGLARRVGRRLEIERRLEALPERIRRFPVAHPAFQILGRCVPVVGLHLVNVASAVHGVRLPRFVVCAMLGHAGPALTMAAIGAGLVQLRG